MIDDSLPAYVVPASTGPAATTRHPADAAPVATEGPARSTAGRPVGIRTVLTRIGLGVVGVLLAAFLSHPLWLAPLLGRYLSSTSGRAVHFDSIRIGLTPSLAPVAHLRGVRIDNAPWAATKAPFAVFADVVFVFAWRHFEGRRVVSHLRLRDGTVNLELRADGLRNWRLVDPEDRGPGRYWFFSLEGRRATLAFIHHRIDLHFQATASDAPGPAGALPTRIDFDGAFREVAFKGSADTGLVLTFMETGRWFPLRGHAAIDGADLEVDGRVADLMRATQIDADASLAGRSLAALRPFVGDRYDAPRAFRAQGHLRSGAGRYALSSAQAHIGATDLAGDAAWSRSGERRTVHAHLKSETTDLADLQWLAGRSPGGALNDTSRVDAASPPRERDLFAAARDLDGDVAFQATHVRAAAWRLLESLALKAELASSQLAVSDLDVGWAGGHTTGTLALDLRQPIAHAGATLETRGIRVESLLGAQAQKKRITGTLRSHLALQATGNTLEALRASVSGTASASLGHGTISSLLDAELGLEGGKLMRTLISGVDSLPLPCAEATIDLKAGQARIRSLVIDSANTRTTGSGSIDLHDEAIDLLLTPTPKRPGLFELQRSIHLFGHLPKPERKLVDRVEPAPTAACEGSKP